jgi:hypothetical protein
MLSSVTALLLSVHLAAAPAEPSGPVSSAPAGRRQPGRAVSATNIPTPHLLLGVSAIVLGGLSTLGGIIATASGEARGLLFAGGGLALGAGGFWVLDKGREYAREEARKQALTAGLTPTPVEREVARLPAVRTGVSLALTFD